MDAEWWSGVAQAAAGEAIGSAVAAAIGFFALRAAGFFTEIPLAAAIKAVMVATALIAAAVVVSLLLAD